jgi:hypothetical protein
MGLRMYQIIYYAEKTGRVFTMMDSPKEWVDVSDGWLEGEFPFYIRQLFCKNNYQHKFKIYSQYVGVNFYNQNLIHNYKFCVDDKASLMHFILKFDNEFEFEKINYSTKE